MVVWVVNYQKWQCIYKGVNLNALLKLFFSLSKKIIFFSLILTNNNLILKIYCESIVKIL